MGIDVSAEGQKDRGHDDRIEQHIEKKNEDVGLERIKMKRK